MRKTTLIAIVLLVAMLVPQDFGPVLLAQTTIPTAQQLDQLLAPVALYPDSLLAQITTASTNAQEILDVDNWLQQNPGLTGTALTDAAQSQGFDPAFIALTNFPQVLDMMAQNIDDYAAIGEAFSADQGAVTASIQRLRAQAYAAGTLQSNSQQQVEVQQAASQTIYVIQPANPQVVYVPVYNPTVVYVKPSTSTVVVTSLVTFGAGIAIGALVASNQPWGWGGWGWGWSSGRVYYNRTVFVAWGNPYRPPNVWYRPRPVRYTSRPGYGGNWRYRPPNYRPPAPAPRPPNRKPWGPNNPPGYRPPAGGTRPPAHKPKPGTPSQPIAKPTPRPPSGTRPPSHGKPNPPAQGRPKPPSTNPPPANGTKPSTPNRPATPPKPAQPSQGRPQPSTNRPPADGSKPPATTRPAPSPKPGTPGREPQTKPTPNPAGGTRPAPQPKPAAPQSRPQPQQKPPSQSKPASKPVPKTQPQ
jgi:hypothetical protein